MEERKPSETVADRDVDGFDRIADRYERYVPWESRLDREIPFLEDQLRSVGARRVLDCASGPGRHAVRLAKRGYEVTVLDISPEMLARARSHAQDEGVAIEVVEGRFESMPESFRGRFDGVLCLGNALSAADSLASVETAVQQMAGVLQPRGLLITQTVDFSVVAKDRVTAAPVRSAQEGTTDFVFVKSFVRIDQQVLIHWVSLEKKEGRWSVDVTCRPILSIEPAFLLGAVERAGFSSIRAYGDYAGSPFRSGTSRDLVLVAGLG